MAMVRMDPVVVEVRAGWFDGRPREVMWQGDRLPVTRLTAVRHEDSAYRVSVGPRTVFEVDTPKARLALSFRHRSRRWTVEALEEKRPRD